MNLKSLKQFFLTKILRKKYYRKGACKCCGECCKHIYIRHGKGVIKDEKVFGCLQLLHEFYTYLNIIGKDEVGLIFECTQLDEETHHCKVHKKRPGICRRYPQEELFNMGGTLSDTCGYRLEPIVTFDEVFDKVKKKN